jgi:4-diphosphocytidyl-2-C-methyl-D-erythritol kinase
MWTTRAPAKVNLTLRMLGVRSDGYHLLETVLQSVALSDVLELRPRAGAFALSCETPGVPVDATNLAWRGAAAMAASLGASLDGWQLHLEKHVPAEAGLGGGSADAAAAARLVAASVGVALAPSALADVIRPIGADVAFFAWGGTMRGAGVGDQLTTLPDVPDAEVVLVRPPFGVSTREAYEWYDHTQNGERRTSKTERRRVRRGSPGDGGRAGERGTPNADRGKGWAVVGNDLQAPVAARHPEIRGIVDRLRAAGATLAAMSGSGSACFGLFEPAADLRALDEGWPEGARVWRTHTLSRAAYAEATAVTASRR